MTILCHCLQNPRCIWVWVNKRPSQNAVKPILIDRWVSHTSAHFYHTHSWINKSWRAKQEALRQFYFYGEYLSSLWEWRGTCFFLCFSPTGLALSCSTEGDFWASCEWLTSLRRCVFLSLFRLASLVRQSWRSYAGLHKQHSTRG